MDFLQQWGIYAPLLLYAWLALAAGLAYLRTRQGRSWLWLFLYGQWMLGYWLALSSGSWRDDHISDSWWQLYGLHITLLFGLIGLGLSGKILTPGYRHYADILLFRAPASRTEIPAP